MAFCSSPSAPYGGAPSKPSTPYCVNEYANTHTCDEWEINNYISDMESYRRDVENYVDELKNYLANARRYVECEINDLN